MSPSQSRNLLWIAITVVLNHGLPNDQMADTSTVLVTDPLIVQEQMCKRRSSNTADNASQQSHYVGWTAAAEAAFHAFTAAQRSTLAWAAVTSGSPARQQQSHQATDIGS